MAEAPPNPDAPSTALPAQGTPTQRLRRNGKQQSCEPCRVQKLRCDHCSPCSRCIKQGRTARCVYHPAPMTRGYSTGASVSPSSASAPPSQHSPFPVPATGVDAVNAAVGSRKTSEGPDQVSERREEATASSGRRGSRNLTVKDLPTRPVNPLMLHTGGDIGYSRTYPRLGSGYLGPTSHSAILFEHKDQLGADDFFDESGMPLEDADEETFHESARSYEFGSGAEHHNRPPSERSEDKPITKELYRFCLNILTWLPQKSISLRIARKFYQMAWCATSHSLTELHFNESFWELYGQTLQQPRTTTKMMRIIKSICNNTRRPMPIPKNNQQWLETMSGKNARWEMVGQMFIMLGFGYFSIQHDDPVWQDIIPPGIDRRSWSLSMLECADACLLLCDEMNPHGNVASVVLLMRAVVYQSVVNGDTGLDLWKRMGSLVNAVTGLGLQGALSTAEEQSPLYAQYRIRTFYHVFKMDKLFSVFLGRPPSLSRRYVNCRLPLDVGETDLMHLTQEELLSKVDLNGWNIDGQLNPATVIRTMCISGFLDEEVLELTLGRPEGDIESRVNELRARCENTWKSLPSHFHAPIDKTLFLRRPAVEASAITSVHLSFTQILFLVERISIPNKEKDETKLLAAARDLLDTVIVYWQQRDKVGFEHRDEVHWFLTAYGIPSASALAIDLWKQKFGRPGELNRLGELGRPDRAYTIQNLSLFVACLDWIEPSDGNYVLCGKVKRMIEHILERVLAPEPSSSGSNSYSTSPYPGWDINLHDISMADVPMFGVDFENWFHTDWTFNQPTNIAMY